MATQEKLLKSLETLKQLIVSTQTADQHARKKEKIQNCNFISEAMLNPTIKVAKNFNNLLSFTMDVLLQLADDQESDVRMTADECLNKIIRAMSNGSITKVQIELHKEIKRNGPARSLRAALWRFALLAHHIRLHKGKPYVMNLFPCLVKILERNEEMIHDTLASSLPKIMSALGCFTMDNDVKSLLKACLANVQNSSAVIRRTTASCILTTCLNCRKPYIFIIYVLNTLIDCLVPIQDSHSTALILGVFGCLKAILPHIRSCEDDFKKQSSFNGRKDVSENIVSSDKLLQIYELCLNYSASADHNVVNASLETLNVLLQQNLPELRSALLSPKGITKSRIASYETNTKRNLRSPSQLSVATTLRSEENLLLEVDLSDTVHTDIEKWIDESKLSVINVNYVKGQDEKDACVVSTEGGVRNSEEVNKICDYSNISIGTIQDQYAESLRSESVADQIDKLILSEGSSEKSFSQRIDEKSTNTLDSDIFDFEIDVGEFLDKTVPLIYLARYISKQYLLTGTPGQTTTDKNTRVSTKNLALNCLSSIIQLLPDVLLMYADRNCAKENPVAKEDVSRQQLSDVLLFERHCDPQLRGNVRTLITAFVKAVMVKSCGDYEGWINERDYVEDRSVFGMKNLMSVILKGLQDESSTCSRLTLGNLSVCLKFVLESTSSLEALPVLTYLPILAKDPYWLVKVKLLEVVTELPFVTIQHVFKTREFQNKIIYNVLFELLQDEDQRVRNAAANSIMKVIPLLYFDQQTPNETTVTSKAINYRNVYIPSLSKNDVDTNIKKKRFVSTTPFPFNVINCEHYEHTEQSLSRILMRLYQHLLTTTSKYFIFGCVETISLLSFTYPTTVYKSAWNCFKNVTITQEKHVYQRSSSTFASTPTIYEVLVSSSSDVLNVVIHLLTDGIVGYDLNCHLNLLTLTGNLIAGKWLESIKPATDFPIDSQHELWDIINDKNLADLSEDFLGHIVKLLNIFSHVLEEAVPSLPLNKQVLPNLPSASNLSPIKRRKSDLGDKKILSPGKIIDKDDKDKKVDVKVNAMGYFASAPHYMKIYDILKVAYNNYKITLDVEASENFLSLLKTTLNTLSQILEVATLTETRRIAEEILSYLKTTFSLEPTATVQCVQQLLKSLFSTNLSADVDDVTKYLNANNSQQQPDNTDYGFYYNVAQLPYNDISMCINNLTKVSKIECDGDSTVMGYLHRKENKKPPNKGLDKILANYIRIFEPMVIKSLKHYTITSNVKLQCQVLQLLSQLVQLRVNYCLLDSEQIFMGFVLKQFEFIEEGQISLSDELIPKIFQFLVNLSYGKQHSKNIIIIPKIIQLCDGLMASGQSPLTHCIPALKPIVEDVFLLRNKSNTADFKDLETTREVLISMLLRLLEYKEIVDLLVLILHESMYCDNVDRWPRWSAQIYDVFLPMLKHNKIHLDGRECMESVKRLIFALHPSVYKNVNEVLIMVFSEPMKKDNPQMCRYVSKMFLLLLILMQLKEDKLLIKIIENQSEFAPSSVFENVTYVQDPLNVTKTTDIFDRISPEVVFLSFVFRLIDNVVGKCVDCSVNEDNPFVIQQLSHLLLYILYIFQSGTHSKITDMAINLINEDIEFDENEKLPMERMNANFLKLRHFCPLLTFQWCYILTLLNYNDRKFWSSILQLTESYGINRQLKNGSVPMKKHCINLEIVRIGGTIVFADYLSENILSDGEQMSWLLVNNIESIVELHNEAPVFELLGSIHRNSAASGLVIQAIATKCLENREPNFKVKILKCVENVHSSQTGNLLMVLIPKLLTTRQLALSRHVANTASRKIEYLLTQPMEEVVKQLPKDELIRIMDFFVTMKFSKKHETLVGLINKLASQFYDLSPLEFDQRRSINPEYIKKLSIDKTWYLSQIKSRCHSGNLSAEGAELLSKLSFEDLVNVMGHKDFNKMILYDCLKWCKYRRKEEVLEEDELFRACCNVLLKDVSSLRSVIPKPHQVFKPEGREATIAEIKYTNRLSEILTDDSFWQHLNNVISPITEYVSTVSSSPASNIPEINYEDLAKIAVLSLETVSFQLDVNKRYFNVDFVTTCMSCSDTILKENYICSILGLNTHSTWLCSAVNSLYRLVSYLLADSEPLPSLEMGNLSEALGNVETRSAGMAVYQISTLINWLEKVNKPDIPKCLLKHTTSIVISLARLPLVNSYILTPPTAWKSGFSAKLSGPYNTQVPPLPIEYLQEIEILEEFIFRITLLGWTSRQQFEETWMCLLSVLSASPTENSVPEEVNAITHSNSLAVQAITSLLLQTLYYPQPGNRNVSSLLHVARDIRITDYTISVKKLKVLHRNFSLKLMQYWNTSSGQLFTDVFNKSNLEKIDTDYSYGQLSMQYLLIATKSVEDVDDQSHARKVYHMRERMLSNIGLDVNSCLQFLLDLYTQWIKSEEILPLRLLQEVVKSIITISDLFNEKSQYQWMLEVCLDLVKYHAIEDEIVHQYLVLAVCKATAILSPDMETYELVKKLITQSLKSAFLSARIAGIHGLLYILQVSVLGNTVIGGVSDELQLFLPIAIEYIQCHMTSNNRVLNQSQEHTLLLWAMAFYVIENIDVPHVEAEFVEAVLNSVLTILSEVKVNISVHIPLIKGIERLIIKKRLSRKVMGRVMKFSLENLRKANPVIALPVTQLLYTSMYIEYSEQLDSNASDGVVQSNPDHMVQTLEKISAVFERIKKGYPFEVEILCTSLPNVLNDFFPPSDILTKVISEYLSPQQRHPMQLSKVVFQIFENTIRQSQLSLLQDWVVFSLTNFTQSFSIGMATWCLTCFFIAASSNVWLRNMFPYVQKRIGRYEYEDRKILCIAGADFYNNLENEVQKKTFVDTLTKVKDQADTPFNELLGCL